MEKEKAKLTNDVAFQLVFGKPGNERITKKLIEDLLGIEIESLTLNTNKRLYGPYIDDKISRLDVKAVLNNGTKVLIEMQVTTYDNLPERFLSYWSKSYVDNLLRGNDYEVLNKTISIVILADNLTRFEGIKKYHTKWTLQEEELKDLKLTDDLEIHIIELKKFKENGSNEKEGNWLNLIKKGEIDVGKTVDKELREAEEELKKILADPETRELYYQREKDLIDKIWGYKSERQAGLKQGLEQGRTEGRAEGRAERDKEMIKAMHDSGIKIDVICKVANLSKEEVEKILKS